MNQTAKAPSKLQEICNTLKAQTLEPAQQEAKEVLENAKIEAKEIKLKAEEEAKKLLAEAKAEIEKKEKMLASSLSLAARQTIDDLKAKIEKKFFKENLTTLIDKTTKEPKTIAKIIEVIVEAIKKEGTSSDFSAYISKAVQPEEIAKELASEILNELSEKKVLQGDFLGGVKIELKDKKITLDVSDKALKNQLADYIRKDFRELIFSL